MNKFKNSLSLLQIVIKIVAVFCSLVAMMNTTKMASAAVVAKSTHASLLIQNYLKKHPTNIKKPLQIQNKVIMELNQLQQLSDKEITKKVKQAQPQQAELPKIYPVRSKALTPGKVISRHIQKNLSNPIFIMGDDPMSKDWLQKYHTRLAKLHAIGFVVNVSSKEAMQALANTFSGLRLLAMPADSIAKYLSLKHYPVLISEKLIEQ
jgi:integrating conjugative element protein (TIGR03765 family)